MILFITHFISRANVICLDDGDLPPVSAPVKAISSVPGYIMPGLQRKQFQDVLAKSASQPASAMPGMRTFGNRTMSEFLPARYVVGYLI